MKRISVVFVLLFAFFVLALAQEQRRTSARERWDKDEVVTLKGEITKVLLPLATFKSEGKEYTVHLGPTWYWRENDYKLEAGAVEIRGEIETEEGELHLYPYGITQGKNSITLAGEDGAPRWSKAYTRMGGMHHGSGGGKCGGGRKCEHGCCGGQRHE